VLLFARGVSNSTSEVEADYERELEMIKSFAKTEEDKIFVYFSTTSVYDTEKQNTKYVKSKLQFEEAIRSLFLKSIIIRLPIIVGTSNNENQLFGYLLKAIRNGLCIKVHNKAARYLIDVADLSTIVSAIVKHYKTQIHNGNETIDICGDKPISINAIIAMLAEAIRVTPLLEYVESGSTYFVDNTAISSIVSSEILNKDFQKVFNTYYQ
jgi:nucleoside-diphosphate-sugar epimerase